MRVKLKEIKEECDGEVQFQRRYLVPENLGAKCSRPPVSGNASRGFPGLLKDGLGRNLQSKGAKRTFHRVWAARRPDDG